MTVPRIEVDDRDVVQALNRLIEIGETPAPALDAIGRVLQTNIQLGFQTSTAPDGTAWEPLKIRQGQPLRDKGHLMGSIDYQVEGNSVVVGTNRAYAPVHQFGATIEAKAGKVLRFFVEGRPVFVKRVTIPARPFLPEERLPEDWGTDSLEAIRGVVRGAWSRGGAPNL